MCLAVVQSKLLVKIWIPNIPTQKKKAYVAKVFLSYPALRPAGNFTDSSTIQTIKLNTK